MFFNVCCTKRKRSMYKYQKIIDISIIWGQNLFGIWSQFILIKKNNFLCTSTYKQLLMHLMQSLLKAKFDSKKYQI